MGSQKEWTRIIGSKATWNPQVSPETFQVEYPQCPWSQRLIGFVLHFQLLILTLCEACPQTLQVSCVEKPLGFLVKWRYFTLTRPGYIPVWLFIVVESGFQVPGNGDSGEGEGYHSSQNNLGIILGIPWETDESMMGRVSTKPILGSNHHSHVIF